MWLPLSPLRFQGSQVWDKYYVSCDGPLVGACVTKQAPLPPLHLLTDATGQLVLSIDTTLESGLCQLRWFCREYQLHPPACVREDSRSYAPGGQYVFSFRHEYWKTFFEWLAEPWKSPNVDKLKAQTDRSLLWEWNLKTIEQGENLHHWLDSNFDTKLACLPIRGEVDTTFQGVFELIYREQFLLLWQTVFENRRLVDEIPGFKVKKAKTEFARVFHWRYSRVFDRVYRLIMDCKEQNTDGKVQCQETDKKKERQRQWGRLLGWLRQRGFERNAVDGQERKSPREISPESSLSEDQRQTEDKSGLLGRQEQEGGSLDQTKSPTSWSDEAFSVLVHSEIQRRRLPERIFAPLCASADDRGNILCESVESRSLSTFRGIILGESGQLLSEWTLYNSSEGGHVGKWPSG
ncbi:Heterokaryon incompatibility het-6 [Fusarium sp. LHS14.1]|nr:Heterokaryon incompatibility het-6 [Fusarium sp. LHS14.1]